MMSKQRKRGAGVVAVKRRNPFLTELLRDRYQVYLANIITYTDKNGKVRHIIDREKYAEAVRQWYKDRDYTVKGIAEPWKAVRAYYARRDELDPNDLWVTPPNPYQKKKSHHPRTEVGRQREREQRKAYRLKKKQQKLGGIK